MATIILGEVGRHYGGQIGAMIGSAVGQAIDSRIFGGGGAEGPRLKELGIQTSGYGSVIPAVFGAVRVAGCVIWATDLIERKTKSGGGKGRPSTTQYTYSVSFAVALSSRPVARVARIWADGNVLRGAAGDFKTHTGFRFYNGYDDQTSDPLIAAAEGNGLCPAFRGQCYAVFEGMELADFGNRIPSLTFELFEREGNVSLADISNAISPGYVACDSQETVSGYAAEGIDARTALSPFLTSMPVMLRSAGKNLALQDYWQAASNSVGIEIAAHSGISVVPLPQQRRGSAGKLLKALALRHYEPARDYQTGVQSSTLSDTGRIAAQVDFPASLTANAARRLADLLTLQQHKSRDNWTGHVVTGEHGLTAGDWFDDPAGDGRWQITEIEHASGMSRISARRGIDRNPDRTYAADAGRSVISPDLLAGTTVLALIDLPLFTDTETGRPVVAIAAAGTSSAWRNAALSLQTSTGLLELGSTATPATIGAAAGVLAAHPSALVDTHNRIEIELLNTGMTIAAGTGDPLASGATLCRIGKEILRIGCAEYLGGKRYRLSMLQRGCHGTEAYIDGHMANETFVVLEPDSLRIVDSTLVSAGTDMTVEALGIGDILPATSTLLVSGAALRPMPPVYGKAEFLLAGGVRVSWIYRTRGEPVWNDFVDVPVFSGEGRYNLQVIKAGIVLSELELAENSCAFSAADIAIFGIAPSDWISFEVRQLGQYGRSNPMTIATQVPA
jgi:hypothetical protein